tara:strand:+ start:415 stop:1116 length:702 start_codon:yes stop_codon:yes gene_type:complete
MKDKSKFSAEGYNSLIQTIIKWDLDEQTKKKFSHLNTDKARRVIYTTATYGWYIDSFDKNSGINLNKCIKIIYNNLPHKLDEYLGNYYKNNKEIIKNDLIKKYPTRENIFIEIFEAYKSGLYHSSICLLLTQIDGICEEIINAKFFLNKNHLPQIKVKLENCQIKYSDFLLSPINKKASINSWEEEISEFPIRLNRHEIIHGVDKTYGNEINFLKVLSMISYTNMILSHFKSD